MSSKQQTQTDTIEDVELKIPKDYKVVMLNDNVTTFEFVVEVLKIIFSKTPEEGEKIAKEIHEKGKSIICIYPYSIAQMKVAETHQIAHLNQFPLKCILERED